MFYSIFNVKISINLHQIHLHHSILHIHCTHPLTQRTRIIYSQDMKQHKHIIESQKKKEKDKHYQTKLIYLLFIRCQILEYSSFY